MTIDNLTIKRGMTYKEFMEKRSKAEAMIKETKQVSDKMPARTRKFILDLMEYFYQEVPSNMYNEFLNDYGYSDEDFIKMMSAVRDGR